MLLLTLGLAGCLVTGFDGDRFKRVAIDWMRVHHARALAFDEPTSLQLCPQPAVTLKGVRLSEPGQPAQPFAKLPRGLTLPSSTVRDGSGPAPRVRARKLMFDRIVPACATRIRDVIPMPNSPVISGGLRT